jgi:hypothetical protein
MDHGSRDSKRRGRPPKFGRPSRIVALTLPEDVIDRLRRVHRDLGWAIVKLIDQVSPSASARRDDAQPDVELVTVADRQSLIVVNREVIRNLPGVSIIPLSGNRAFLALDIDRGMSDLELSVTDRLADSTIERRERHALGKLRAQLTTWRRDRELRCHTRAIIVVERRVKKPSDHGGFAARGAAAKRMVAKTWALIATPKVRSAGTSHAAGKHSEISAHADRDGVAGVLVAALSSRETRTIELCYVKEMSVSNNTASFDYSAMNDLTCQRAST